MQNLPASCSGIGVIDERPRQGNSREEAQKAHNQEWNLKSAGIEDGLLINFGSFKFKLKKYVMSHNAGGIEVR